MDVSEENNDTTARPHQLHTPEQMKDEFYKTDAFKNIQMPRDPYWTRSTVEDRDETHTYGLMVITIIDPDGSIAERLTQTRPWFFGKQCQPKTWKEPINLVQCPRCWCLGLKLAHTDCQICCRMCGSSKHDEENHNKACMACHAEFGQNADLPTHMCPHIKCKNCGCDHPADEETCQGRSTTAQNIRDTRLRGGKSLIPNNQPMLFLNGSTGPRNVPLNRYNGKGGTAQPIQKKTRFGRS